MLILNKISYDYIQWAVVVNLTNLENKKGFSLPFPQGTPWNVETALPGMNGSVADAGNFKFNPNGGALPDPVSSTNLRQWLQWYQKTQEDVKVSVVRVAKTRRNRKSKMNKKKGRKSRKCVELAKHAKGERITGVRH